MRIEDFINDVLRGKKGNLIIYKRGETWCLRRADGTAFSGCRYYRFM
ncbi:hypothetical protein [Butyricimonas synergistica]|nr:hypothetical protein [Butyricimonas synergistica]